MSHYKPYLAYKDSGVEWIGPVPEHWETVRIKRGASLRNERRNDSPDGWTYVGLEDVESESGRYAPTAGVSRQSEDSMVGVFHAGDVLYGKLRPYLRKAIVAERDGLCSTEFLVLSPGRSAAPWVHRWLLTKEVTQQIEAGCDGAKMPRADWEHVGSIPMPLPPSAEQTTIAAALDHETARIDALIAKKTRFIELLKEKRQALITHAVTKGLDPNVKMKDSGVEWIGEVPKHWVLMKFGRVARVTEGLVDPRLEPYLSMPLFAPNHIESITGRLLAVESAADQDAESGKYLCKAGCVVYSKIRPALSKVIIAPTDGLCSADMYPLTCTDKAEARWLFYLMLSQRFTAWAVLESDRVAMPKINRESLAELVVAVPPVPEQQKIASSIAAQLPRVDAVIERVNASIALLKERRSAFITAAVTGQIDLREAA